MLSKTQSYAAPGDATSTFHLVDLTAVLGGGTLDLMAVAFSGTRARAEAFATARLDRILALASQSCASLVKGEKVTCTSFANDVGPDGTPVPRPPATGTCASIHNTKIYTPTVTHGGSHRKRRLAIPTFCKTSFKFMTRTEMLCCDLIILGTPDLARHRAVKIILEFFAAVPEIQIDDVSMTAQGIHNLLEQSPTVAQGDKARRG